MNKPSKWDYHAEAACSVLTAAIIVFCLIVLSACASRDGDGDMGDVFGGQIAKQLKKGQ